MTSPQMIKVPLPEVRGECSVTTVPGSRFIALEFHGPGSVPGRGPEVKPFGFRLLFNAKNAAYWAGFFGSYCPQEFGTNPGPHGVRLNPPGTPVELVAYLTRDQCETIGEAIRRAQTIANRTLAVVR